MSKLAKKELVQIVKGEMQALVNAQAEAAGKDAVKVTNVTAENALDAVTAALQVGLEGGNNVSLYGFGTFELRQRAARTGRNPQTGEALEISAMTGVGFKPSTGLKASVRNV